MKRQKYVCTNTQCPNTFHYSARCPNLSAQGGAGSASTTALSAPPKVTRATESPDDPFVNAANQLRAGGGTEKAVRIPVEDLNIETMTAAGKEITHLEVDLYYSKGGTNHFRGVEGKRGYYLSVQPVRIEDGFIDMVPSKGKKMLLEEAGRRSAGKQQLAREKVTPPLIESMASNLEGYRRKKFNLPEGFTVEEQWRIKSGNDRVFSDIYDAGPGSRDVDQVGRLTALNLGYPVGHKRGSSIQHAVLNNGKTVGLGGVPGKNTTRLHLYNEDGLQEHTFELEGDLNSPDHVEVALKAAESENPAEAFESMLYERGYEVEKHNHAREFSHEDLEGSILFV